MKILGISAFYHDSAAALIINGEIIAAAQEERFTRIKYDSSYPENAVNFCLSQAGIKIDELDAVVFYDKPWLKFERVLETFYAFAPKGVQSFRSGLPIWIKEKALLPKVLRKYIPENIPLRFSNHHLSHASSAFYPSPFESAAILTMDGVGEWATTTISQAKDSQITILKEMSFPHSVGLLYSAFTQFCGFKVNSGEYKLMGLAPYGRRGHPEVEKFKQIIKTKLCHIYEDGGIWLDQSYFSYATGKEMINEKWYSLFQSKPRKEEEKLTQVYCDLALAIQEVIEEVILKLAQHAKEITQETSLCLAGGVALNCVANSVLKKSKIFDHIWIQPAAGDAGGALGAALAFYYAHPNKVRVIEPMDSMKGSYLGPTFSPTQIQNALLEKDLIIEKVTSNEILCDKVAKLISEGDIVGWFQGSMEYGPRALGNRSILADPRSPEMQKKLNLKIKYREGFRPFAPSCLEEDVHLYFDQQYSSPYMLLIDHVKDEHRYPLSENYEYLSIDERLYFKRSNLPCITHLDYSARLQTVSQVRNPLYHELISAFKKKTGVSMIVNTSFNVRGEPIVCTPEEALNCFFQTEMDVLVLGNFIIEKRKQDAGLLTKMKSNHPSAFKLD